MVMFNVFFSIFSFAMIELGSDTSVQLVTEKLPKMYVLNFDELLGNYLFLNSWKTVTQLYS